MSKYDSVGNVSEGSLFPMLSYSWQAAPQISEDEKLIGLYVIEKRLKNNRIGEIKREINILWNGKTSWEYITYVYWRDQAQYF